MTQAFVNPTMLSWARRRAGLAVSALARKLGVDPEKISAWETGELMPTFRQAQQFAHHTYIPFGYLFLRQPPEEVLPIPDLRTVGDHAPETVSLNLRDTLHDVMQRQAWYRDYQQEREAETAMVVGCMAGERHAAVLATDMKTRMKLPARPERGTWEAYMRDLVTRIEALGILVMRNSMVGSNTHRGLEVREFRGFAIVDRYAPVIFINTADCPEARLFTLIHELAHIWLGESGISDASPQNTHETEKLCNAVAAEFLAPEEEFETLWQHDMPSWRANLPMLSAHFHVSQWVIARRAHELGYITAEEYWRYVNERLAEHKARDKAGNPPYGRLQVGRVSKPLARAVASEALSGRMLLREAWQLIGIKPAQLADFARKELNA